MKTKMYSLALMFCMLGAAQGQWAPIDSIDQGSLLSINFINADTGFAFNEWGTLRKTVDGGLNWDTVQIPFTSFIYDIDFADANNGYAVGGAWFATKDYYAFSIMKTTDGGTTWDSVYGNLFGGVFNYVEAVSPNEFYASGSSGLVHSSDGGATLDTLQISTAPNGVEGFGRIRFLDANRGYVLGSVPAFGAVSYNIYETTDGGQSWQKIFSDSVSSYNSDFVMTSTGNGLLVGERGSVLRTTDGGQTWQEITLGDTAVTFTKVEEVEGQLHAIGTNANDNSQGIYSSTDGGVTWYQGFSTKKPNEFLSDLSVPTTSAGYCISWQKIYKSTNMVSLRESRPALRFQMYPNPAFDFVSIESAEKIRKLILHNSVGQKVKEVDVAGKYTVSLNVGFLKSGVYLVEVQYAEGSFTTKVLKK